MRLSDDHIQNMTSICRTMILNLDAQAQLWLFGSRVDDEVKGGDVDLCLLSHLPVTKLMMIKLTLRPELEELLDLPVDLIVQSFQQPLKSVTQQALLTGIRLI